MNIINDRELALRFKNDAVPSQERFIYLFIFVLISEIPWSSFSEYIFNDNRRDYDIYSDIIISVITIVGTVLCYRTNRSGDDREFIERYVGIGFPITIRTTIFLIVFVVVSIIFFVVMSIVLYFLNLSLNSELNLDALKDAWGTVMGACAMAYFFVRLNASIKLAASAA